MTCARPTTWRACKAFGSRRPRDIFGSTTSRWKPAGYYALGQLLGHQVLSLNAIVANRATGEFAPDPAAIMDELIARTLALV